jgi:pimeloyl-ACP methyl ester carboxylesterase
LRSHFDATVTRLRRPLPPPPANPSAPIVFGHANGFPAGTYRLLFEAWQRAGHEVHALERFGQDPAYPVGENWPHLRDQLIAFIESDITAKRRPVWLVGHSLGGIVCLLAASHRPDLVRGIVLLDSPVITGWRAHALHMLKRSRVIQRIAPVRVALVRRHAWPSRTAVLAHFQPKRAFARWDPRVLADYVASGFVRRGRQTVLAIERELEARIYATLPHHIGPLLRRHPIRCPVGFIGGRQSVEARQAGLEATRRLVGAHFLWTEGSHLFPMEHPDLTAAQVLAMMAGMAKPG